jgi:hypothetical protein
MKRGLACWARVKRTVEGRVPPARVHVGVYLLGLWPGFSVCRNTRRRDTASRATFRALRKTRVYLRLSASPRLMTRINSGFPRVHLARFTQQRCAAGCLSCLTLLSCRAKARNTGSRVGRHVRSPARAHAHPRVCARCTRSYEKTAPMVACVVHENPTGGAATVTLHVSLARSMHPLSG